MQEIASFICDYCGEENTLPIDPGGGARQSFVYDCAICCRPSLVHVEIDDDGEAYLWAEREQD